MKSHKYILAPLLSLINTAKIQNISLIKRKSDMGNIPALRCVWVWHVINVKAETQKWRNNESKLPTAVDGYSYKMHSSGVYSGHSASSSRGGGDAGGGSGKLSYFHLNWINKSVFDTHSSAGLFYYFCWLQPAFWESTPSPSWIQPIIDYNQPFGSLWLVESNMVSTPKGLVGVDKNPITIKLS